MFWKHIIMRYFMESFGLWIKSMAIRYVCGTYFFQIDVRADLLIRQINNVRLFSCTKEKNRESQYLIHGSGLCIFIFFNVDDFYIDVNSRLIPTCILPVAWIFYYENIVRYFFTKGKNFAETSKEFTKKLNLKCFQKYKFRIT